MKQKQKKPVAHLNGTAGSAGSRNANTPCLFADIEIIPYTLDLVIIFLK